MSKRDYSKQVAKRQRIRRSSLVGGVDVGKTYNAVGFMNKEGKVLGSCAKIYNSHEGFEQFLKMVEDLKARYGLKDVLIGMEPTGHYWRQLAYFAREHGYEVRFIRTTALKHHRSKMGSGLAIIHLALSPFHPLYRPAYRSIMKPQILSNFLHRIPITNISIINTPILNQVLPPFPPAKKFPQRRPRHISLSLRQLLYSFLLIQ